MKNKNLIFVPVFNNQLQIDKILEDLKQLDPSKFDTLLIIDNNSSDSTFKIIENKKHNFKYKLHLIKNKKNIGLGGSFKVAINYALNNKFDYIFHYHGNSMNSISDLLKILNEEDVYSNLDFYFGSRFEKKSVVENYSKIKILGNLIFNFIFSFFLKTKLTDLGGSINVFKVSNFINRFFLNFSNDLTFQYYIILYAAHYKKNYKFFPLKIKINHKSNVVALKHIISMIKIITIYCIKKEKFFK